jgi:hypothetical protein
MAYNATQITTDAKAVTPSDSTAVSFFGFYVGITGDVTVVTAAGSTTTFTAVPAGQIIPVAVSKIKATGTTATDIVGFGPK